LASTASPAGAPDTATAHFSPATLNAFDEEASVTPTAAPGANDTNGVCTAPGSVSGAWISSEITNTPYRAASAAIRARSSAEKTRPVGLCGLHSR
jgi:hypothetical protein